MFNRRITKYIRTRSCGKQSGFTLIEAIIGIALLSIVAVAVLAGVSTAFKADALADRQSTAMSLIMNQIESLQLQLYQDADSGSEVYYTKISDIPANYSIWSYNRAGSLVTDIVGVPWSSVAVEVTDDTVDGTATVDDEGLQKIRLVVKQGTIEVLTLAAYKVR